MYKEIINTQSVSVMEFDENQNYFFYQHITGDPPPIDALIIIPTSNK